ncbi:Piso0_001405 [Millerozyma farinosa CBS 7064]|uniref:Ubiquitin-conjugating enzyme E2 6 n=1 Tax=Pichia sorbitophila (strain ATCC MYA-4447 / BCRC 22081 / CBS 7064 / NBRC 10061 / NRRL Y-12695) TaxID=559304 RepID=G8YKP9_PICSO|nr:Piso0_001405 [Millerozyma farinosa CBS 7064]
MASRQAQRRLTKEYKAISTNPPPYITARPNEENILEWHYVITGPADTPFEGGQYHGLLRFPAEYPFKPPSITMTTPNGRFSCNTRLCLSMSDFHPDTWNPAWSVATILTGLLSFMTGDESTTGSINTSDNVKRKLARSSKEWNITDNHRFVKHFPDLVAQNTADIKELKRAEAAKTAQAAQKPPELPFDIRRNLDKLDPEDRARLLVENDADIPMDAASSVFQKFTIFGVVVAAFVAAYFKLTN